MKGIIMLLLMVGLLVGCGQPPPAAEEEPPPVPVNEDDLLLRLSAYLSTDTSRAAREQNEIVDYAIENLLDVQVSNSGLFYGVRQEGDGEAIAWGDYLKVHYKGYLLDGTVFADSREQDRPLSFYVGNMIPAWNEGLAYIKVGGKLLLLVPSHLGYGADGLKTSKGRVIVPPYQILAFEVEVLEKGEDQFHHIDIQFGFLVIFTRMLTTNQTNMTNRLFLLFFCGLLFIGAQAQKQELTYYLPDIAYDPAIPTPEEFLGWQIGEWHISHDQQLAYMRMLAAASPRITLTEYARTHEQRPLVYLTITSVANHADLPTLKERHVALSNSEASGRVDIGKTPLVLYQGFSIHGNEPSGGNAAPLVAYYLAAGQGAEIDALLDNTIILFDPCYNPDGFTRFSTWANMHKNLNLTADPADREYDESWPGGRTNHYWFDLNRDWLPVQHPEGRGRVVTFHDWKPNVLTDHHEMGTNSTFFFMPGEPSRVHPLTPGKNQQLTGAIGNYHAEALDGIGSLYYSEEGYDDYYIGKGSTYPDVNGCIGILFEQASSRGHLQESDNGLLTFPFTIRNQVKTALSTHAAVVGLKTDILSYQRDFYQNARTEAKADSRFGYVFGTDGDPSRANHLIDMLLTHKVAVHPLEKDARADGKTFRAGEAYVVPMNQDQYRFIKAVFDPILEFEDSLFYDISTWTLPMACNLPYASLNSTPSVGDALTAVPTLSPTTPASSTYAYLLPWNDFYAPRLAYYLMDKGLRLKVTTEPSDVGGNTYAAGTVVLPVVNQGDYSAEEIHALVKEGVAETGVEMIPVNTGLSSAGPDLGSRKYHTLEMPKVAIVVGEGVTSYEAGTNWHLLDQRYHIPVTKLTTENIGRTDLSRYNVIILPNGNYRFGTSETAKIQDWVGAGGTLIAQKGANRWCASNKLAELNSIKIDGDKRDQRPYGKIDRDGGGRVLGGAIFNTEVDLTHPLLYGFTRTDFPVFQRGNLFYEVSKNPYATPIRFTNDPLLSGYVHPSSLDALEGSAAVLVSGRGRGRTISMMQEPAFRAFWFGTSKLLANAIFFGSTIDRGACEAVK